jgi:hypothetical protein
MAAECRKRELNTQSVEGQERIPNFYTCLYADHSLAVSYEPSVILLQPKYRPMFDVKLNHAEEMQCIWLAWTVCPSEQEFRSH